VRHVENQPSVPGIIYRGIPKDVDDLQIDIFNEEFDVLSAEMIIVRQTVE
jgi:hypothetical protein